MVNPSSRQEEKEIDIGMVRTKAQEYGKLDEFGEVQMVLKWLESRPT